MDGPTADADRPIVLALSGSVRTGSLNEQLALIASRRLRDAAIDARYVDLRDYPMVLFDPDLEAAEGPPPEAHALARLLAPAAGLVIASPEYNGAMSPLLKNTVDWISRVEFGAFMGKKVLLLSATQGSKGGANGLEIVAAWLANILVDVHRPVFALAKARDELAEGDLQGDASARLDALIGSYALALRHVGE